MGSLIDVMAPNAAFLACFSPDSGLLWCLCSHMAALGLGLAICEANLLKGGAMPLDCSTT